MMRKMFMSRVALLAAFAVFGCGGAGTPGQALIEVPEMGLTMQAPSGWRVHRERGAPLVCYWGDFATCIVMSERLEGKPFREYARELSSESRGSRIVSSTTLSVNGRDAVRDVIESAYGSTLLKLYIHRGDELVMVSFATRTGDFPGQEASLLKSLESVRIK